MVKQVTTINKEAIATELKTQLGFSNLICQEIVNKIFSGILNIVNNNKKLHLKNFGSFAINQKSARPGMNFKQKTEMKILPKKTMSFIASKTLKILVNNEPK